MVGFNVLMFSITENNILIVYNTTHKNKYILLDVLLCSIAEYFYELSRVLASL